MTQDHPQAEFPHDRQRRCELLDSMQLTGKRQTLQAALLMEIERLLPNVCYMSQERLARRYRVSERTVRRAFLDLVKMGVVRIETRFQPTVGKVLNHYFIVWSEVERLSIDRTQLCPVAQPTDRTNRADRPDKLRPPTGQIEATDRTQLCPPIQEGLKNTNTTELVCVVSSFGVGLAEQAVMAALASGLDESEIRMRCGAFEALPPSERFPGTLYNWLTKPGSFQTPKPARKKTGPTIDIEAAKKEREANQAAARSQPSMKEMYRNGNLKTQEATA